MADEKDLAVDGDRSEPENRRAVETEEETDVVLLDVGAANLESGAIGSLKLAADGHTVLVPQPSDDPNDPLNWSWRRKHTILLIVSFTSFLADYGSASGIPLIVLQGIEWNMTPNDVNFAGNLNVIMLGIGGLIWIPCVSFWGRGPVMFWTTLAGTLVTLACALAQSFPVYYGFRALMGLTLTAFQAVGLSVVKDMFFFHEHARKIGIWVSIFIVSPYMAPFFGNFIVAGTGQWRPVFWLVFGCCCLMLSLIVIFYDETYYNRSVPREKQPERSSKTRLLRLLGIWQIKHHSYFRPVWRSCYRLIQTFFKPIIIPCMLYYMMSFMWAVGINITSSILFETPIAAGGYGYGPKAVGFLYFTPIVSVCIGEAFGHFFNDWLANRYIKRHAGMFKPEARLWTSYISASLMIPGLIIVGIVLQKDLSVAGIVIGWGMYVVGVMTASVAITAYALDSYPSASAEVAGLLNFARVIGGFTVGYFQQPWGLKDGYSVSFGVQAAIVAVAMAILISLQIFGPTWRSRGGQVHW